jgi:hypothetical protein
MRDLVYIIILSGLILLLFLRPIKENELFDKGFNEGITSIGQTVARLQDRYDSIKKYSENNVEIQIQKQWIIKHKYDTIYIKLDSLSEDSTHKLFLKLYE